MACKKPEESYKYVHTEMLRDKKNITRVDILIHVLTFRKLVLETLYSSADECLIIFPKLVS